MDLNWCCSEFESRIYVPGTDGFKTLVVIRAKGGVSCYVQFQPQGKSPKDLSGSSHFQIKFCPWCGADLAERYDSSRPSESTRFSKRDK
jgi:hypothetical protein